MNDTTQNSQNPQNSISTPIPGVQQTTLNKGAQPEGRPGRSIDFLMDIPLELTVEIGRRSMTMGELIELTPGTVVELDHGSDENLDIMVNGKLVARGEAVMVGERYGVRVMEIIGEDPFKSTTE